MIKFYVRRVVGRSMVPALKPGQIVMFGYRRGVRIEPNKVVLLNYGGREIVKRVQKLDDEAAFVVGDNSAESIDSRCYGAVKYSDIIGVLIWPRRL